LVNETEHLFVFKNKQDTSKFYQTDVLAGNLSELEPLKYERIYQTEYRIYPEKKYVVFTSSYSPDWEYSGQKPEKYEAVNLYESRGEGKVIYGKSASYVLGYLFSLIIFFLLVLVIMRNNIKVIKK